MDNIQVVYWVLMAAPSIVIASTIHEYAHGLTAYKLGDPTAKLNGRLTLNPLSHLDPLGVLCMVIFRFGWSKPVPIDERQFPHSKRTLYTALTALAGPLSNFLIFCICALLNKILSPIGIPYLALYTFAQINLILTVFNLIPIPPLDGHKIVRGFLPRNIQYYWEEMEKYRLILLIILILPVTPYGSLASIIINNVVGKLFVLFGF